MNTNKLLQTMRSGWSPIAVITVTTLAIIAISIYCLASGYFIIFQNLFYIPIIIACVYYTKRGFAFSVIIACLYFLLTIAFTRESSILLQAFVRVLFFVLVAGVITYLSLARKRVEEALRRQQENLEGLVQERTAQLEENSTERKQTEEALLGSEARYRHLLDAMLEGCQIIGFDWRYLYVNDAVAQHGHQAKEILLGHTMMEIYPGIENTELFAALRRCMNERTPQQMENEFAYPDETKGWFELSIQPVPEGIFILSIDITERKRVDQQLKEREALLNEVGVIAKLGGWEMDITTGKATWSKGTYNIVEIDYNKPVPGLHEHVGYYLPEYREMIESKMNALIETKQPMKFEAVLKTAKGNIKWCQALGEAVVKDGKLIKLRGTFQDITERKQAEEELIKSESKFRAIFDNASTGMFILDLQAQKFFMCNSMCAKMLGYTEEEFLNRDVADIHPGEDLPFINEQIGNFIRGEEGIRSDIRFKRKNGSIFSADLNPALLIIADKEYLLISFLDITERKQKEEEIRSRTDELSALYQLSRLLADANDLEHVIELVNHHAVESVHTTFACIALMEDGDLVMRAFYPVRVLDHEFIIGERQPVTALPVCQRVLIKNDPVILQAGSPEVGSLERLTLQLDFARSVCLVPLQAGDPSQDINQALGLLILGEVREEKREAFTPEKIRLAQGIGDQAAATIRRMLLREQAGRRLQQLASLGEIDRTIASSFDLHVSLQMILQHIIGQLKVDAADVLVLNKHLQTLETAAGRGFHSPVSEHKRLRLGEGQAGQAALERHIIQIPDVANSGAAFAQPEIMKAENIAAYFAVPLITKGQVMGVLEIYQRTPLDPNEEWLDFLRTLAGQAAIAIDNVQMFDNLQRSTDELELAYDATIEGWSHALDLRDKETEGHAMRVTQMTVDLARTFGLGENELVQVRWGGLLHDIGKMGVPDVILLKPGPLTDEEWVAMKKHPTFAYEMLSPIHYLRLALDIPYCHHEKWDGTGYPRGLKGEQIPFTARIFIVVDVWDALTSDRPYRKAWTREKAKEYIQEQAGKQFDPTVVETFMKEELQS
jgi:PAS domain S-box-containing protein